jgi:hypothetical protein
MIANISAAADVIHAPLSKLCRASQIIGPCETSGLVASFGGFMAVTASRAQASSRTPDRA